MKIFQTPLNDLFQIEPAPRKDDRGFFARAFCAREFAAHGLETAFVQANLSMNYREGTIRGLHLQKGHSAEVKVVRCTAGAVFDVAVDLRPESTTYLRWFGANLSAENGRCLYVPQGFAHGFQSLTPNATLYYLVSAFHDPTSEIGLRYDDPTINIRWPLPVAELSAKDADWPNFDSAAFSTD